MDDHRGEKNDGLEIISIGSLYKGGLWGKKYWSSSRGKDRHPYPIGYHATRTVSGKTYKMEICEGSNGPLFVMSSTDGYSCNGNTPDIAWDAFQKSFASREGKHHGKGFSSKIDGSEIFGFRNAFVQRHLRELMINVDGVVESISPSDSTHNGCKHLDYERQDQYFHVYPDLLSHLKKEWVTRKRGVRTRSFLGTRKESSNKRQCSQCLPCPCSAEHGEEDGPGHGNTCLDASPLSQDKLVDKINEKSAESFSSQSCGRDGLCETLSLPLEISTIVIEGETENHVEKKLSPGPDSEGRLAMPEAVCCPVINGLNDANPKVRKNSLTEAGSSSDSANGNLEKIDLDLAGLELAKSMMTLLLPKAVPLLKRTYKRRLNHKKQDTDVVQKIKTTLFAEPITRDNHVAEMPSCRMESDSRKNINVQCGTLSGDSHVYVARSDSLEKVIIQSPTQSQQLAGSPNLLCDDMEKVKQTSICQFEGGKSLDAIALGFQAEGGGHLFSDSLDFELVDACISLERKLEGKSMHEERGISVHEHCFSEDGPLENVCNLEIAWVEGCTSQHFKVESINITEDKSMLGDGFSGSNRSECLKQITQTPHLNYHNLENVGTSVHTRFQTILCSPNKKFEISTPNNLVSTNAYVATGLVDPDNHVHTCNSSSLRDAPIASCACQAPLSERIICSNFRDEDVSQSQNICNITNTVGKKFVDDRGTHLYLPNKNAIEHISQIPHSVVSENQGADVNISCTAPCFVGNCFTSIEKNIMERNDLLIPAKEGFYVSNDGDESIVNKISSESVCFLNEKSSLYSASHFPDSIPRHDSPEKKFSGLMTLVGHYIHPNPVLSVSLRSKTHCLQIYVLCGLKESSHRNFFIYKISFQEQQEGCPSFLGYTSLLFPSIVGDIRCEGSGLMLSPDGRLLVFLGNIKAPICREQNMNCMCTKCEVNWSNDNIVRIACVEYGYVTPLMDLKSTARISCLSSCASNILVAAREDRKLQIWNMNATWSASLDEFYLPYSDCVSHGILELQGIPNHHSLILGHDGTGSFVLWDILKRAIVAHFSCPNETIFRILPLRFSYCGNTDVAAPCEEMQHAIKEAKLKLPSLFCEISHPLLFDDVSVWLLIFSTSTSELQHNNKDRDNVAQGGWRVALLAKSKVLIGNELDRRVSVVDASDDYGIAGRFGGLVYLWELSSGKQLFRLHPFRSGDVTSVKVDSDLGILATGSSEGHLLIYARNQDV